MGHTMAPICIITCCVIAMAGSVSHDAERIGGARNGAYGTPRSRYSYRSNTVRFAMWPSPSISILTTSPSRM